MKKNYLIIVLTTLLGACAAFEPRTTPAPIVDGTTAQTKAPVSVSSTPASAANAPNKNSALVEDTTDSTVITKATDDGTVVSDTKPVVKPASSMIDANKSSDVAKTSALIAGVDWLVPTKGKIYSKYSVASKGIDVQGKEGQSIFASNAGTVAYSGDGLKGYGNLVIIKHDDNFLTAYSHNKTNLVKVGDKVKRGQVIALLGKTESDKPILHFELRKAGKPIDPTALFAGQN